MQYSSFIATTNNKLSYNSVIVFFGASFSWGFPGGSGGKTSARDAGDPVSIPGLGRSPGEGNGTHSSTLAWKIPWLEEPGRLQSIGLQRVRHY